MFSFIKERTTYDKVEEAVFTVCREAIEEGNTDFLARGLPILAIAESLEDVHDEDNVIASSQVAISTFDTTDPLMYTPKVLHLNEDVIKQLSDEDIVNVIKRSLKYDTAYVDTTKMDNTELTLFDKDGKELDHTTAVTLMEHTATGVEEEEASSSAGSATIDFEVLSEMMKKMAGEIEEAELAEEAEATARVDKYKMSLKNPKTSTIVSEDNDRYKDVTLTDEKYEGMLDEVAEVQDILDSAIESSGMSKVPSDTPDKRLAVRNVVIGHHKEYFSHKMMYGKTLDIVIVLDRSGSMGGTPARDSAILITAMNNLTHLYPELSCTILFSDDSSYATMDFPVGTINDRELLSFTEVHGAEGLAENMDKELERLEKADCIFVYTDGDIVSGLVDKPSYTAKGIELTGLYTAGGVDDKLSLEDYNHHYNKNKAYFHNVIISATATGVAEEMREYMEGV